MPACGVALSHVCRIARSNVRAGECPALGEDSLGSAAKRENYRNIVAVNAGIIFPYSFLVVPLAPSLPRVGGRARSLSLSLSRSLIPPTPLFRRRVRASSFSSSVACCVNKSARKLRVTRLVELEYRRDRRPLFAPACVSACVRVSRAHASSRL